MKSLLTILGLLFTVGAGAQVAEAREAQLNAYLDSIRNNPVALTAFFQQMPKGGDLHHHFAGSVYTETYVEHALQSDRLYINPNTLEVVDERPRRNRRDWRPIREWRAEVGDYEAHRLLLRYWSSLDFVPGPVAGYDDFFDSFGRFWVGEGRDFHYHGLMELKARAEAENVDYLETMLFRVKLPNLPAGLPAYDTPLRQAQSAGDEVMLDSLLQQLANRLDQAGWRENAMRHNATIAALHDRVFPEGAFHGTLFRYQNYAVRTQAPVKVFAELYADFLSADSSSLVVGVNIVAPEHHPVALEDYWLHMQMFGFLKRRFPTVKTAMHAGELRLGLVAPEDLTWHIRAAVEMALADRIGHGVDIAHERDPYRLLALLAERGIAVEINLTSNAFILGVEGPEHPFMFYHRAKVPMVISTDDAGVLRTNLTAQYVHLAQHYHDISYSDIKELVRNGIRYSFLEEGAQRSLLNKLNQSFLGFELRVMRR